MVAIAVGARLALPGYGPELLRHLFPFLRLLALLCLLTGALGGKLLLTLRLGGIAPIAIDRAAQGRRERMGLPDMRCPASRSHSVPRSIYWRRPRRSMTPALCWPTIVTGS